MKKTYQKLITACLLISSFIIFCGIDACEKRYIISGTVDGDVVSGVTITLSGDVSDNTTTDSSGNYSFPDILNGNYTVIPSLSGYTFNPDNESVIVDGGDEDRVDFIATNPCAVVDRFLDNNDGTVTDCRTDLIWLKNANCTETIAEIGKSSGTLTWYNAETWSSGLADGSCGLTDGSEAGEWRQPTKEELQRIGTDPPTTWDLGYPDSDVTWTKPDSPFVNVQYDYFWSSTMYVSNTAWAWDVRMDDGNTTAPNKVGSHLVWPVRSDN